MKKIEKVSLKCVKGIYESYNKQNVQFFKWNITLENYQTYSECQNPFIIKLYRSIYYYRVCKITIRMIEILLYDSCITLYDLTMVTHLLIESNVSLLFVYRIDRGLCISPLSTYSV